MNKHSIGWGVKLTNPNRKKVLLMISLSLFVIALISLGTYAIWTSELFTGDSSISSGQVKMGYTETNEIGMSNALPIKDEEGKVSTNYFDFQVLSYVKTRANDSTQRKINYKVILEPITVENPLSDSEIKVYLTKVTGGTETVVVQPTTIDQLSNYVLNSQDEVFSNGKAEVVTSYRLRAWIDEKVDTNKLNEKSYSYRFRININSGDVTSSTTPVSLDESGANQPALTSNMIPVYYDSASDSWKKADSDNADKSSQWYDYDNKMWANAVTVSETNRQTYLSAKTGTTIPMSDINTMWVWVPRYTYTYLNTNTPQEINVKFESGTASTGTIKCTDNVAGTSSTSETCTDTTNNGLVAGTSTYTHPAFWWDKNDNNVREENEELTGIWVGKFEISSGQIIKPNVTSLRSQTVNQLYTGIYNMRNSGNAFGFSTTDETHMMKNMEWGAVAYLSHSKYGINKEVAINSANTFTTGCGPQSEGSISYGATCNSYTTALGQSASTTGNISGVYDMSGGAYEYVMGNMVNSSGAFYSSYASFTPEPEARYYDKYSYGTSNTEYTRGKLGDATKEMAPVSSSNTSWYSDYAIFPNSSNPWFIRGGYYSSSAYAGAFYFYNSIGIAISSYSSRAVLGVLD